MTPEHTQLDLELDPGIQTLGAATLRVLENIGRRRAKPLPVPLNTAIGNLADAIRDGTDRLERSLDRLAASLETHAP